MALTVNQKRLLAELVHSKIDSGAADLDDILVQLAEATDVQIANRLKVFAGEQKAARIAQRAHLLGATLANIDALIAFYEAED